MAELPAWRRWEVRFAFAVPVSVGGHEVRGWTLHVMAHDWQGAALSAAAKAPWQLADPVLQALARSAYEVETL
jgi:hypothetical protein